MSDTNEVWRLDLDMGAFEAKARKVEQLVEEIKAKRDRHEDTSELEASLTKELDGLADLTRKEEEAGGATEDLLKQKEKLGAVVRTMGGQFSGAVGDVGGLVKLLMSGSSAALGFGAALAGMTAGLAVVRHIREELARLRDEQEKIDEQWRQFKDTFKDASDVMSDTMRKYAALTPETEEYAGQLRRSIERAGFDRQTAVQVAPLAAMESMTTEEAILAAQISLMGVALEAGKVKEAIIGLRAKAPDIINAAERQNEAAAGTQRGMYLQAEGEAQPIGGYKGTPEDRILAYLKSAGVMVRGEDDEYRAPEMSDISRVKELADLIKRYEQLQELVKDQPAVPGVMGDDLYAQSRIERYTREYGELQGQTVIERLRLEREREMAPRVYQGSAEPPAYSAPVTIIQAGTINLTPGRTHRPMGPTISLSRQMERAHGTPIPGG